MLVSFEIECKPELTFFFFCNYSACWTTHPPTPLFWRNKRGERDVSYYAVSPSFWKRGGIKGVSSYLFSWQNTQERHMHEKFHNIVFLYWRIYQEFHALCAWNSIFSWQKHREKPLTKTARGYNDTSANRKAAYVKIHRKSLMALREDRYGKNIGYCWITCKSKND